MDAYKKLIKTLEKEVFSYKELQEILNNDLVVNAIESGIAGKHQELVKYSIVLQNDETYFIYIKRPFSAKRMH